MEELKAEELRDKGVREKDDSSGKGECGESGTCSTDRGSCTRTGKCENRGGVQEPGGGARWDWGTGVGSMGSSRLVWDRE